MVATHFELSAEVRSQRSDQIRAALTELLPDARIEATELRWSVHAAARRERQTSEPDIAVWITQRRTAHHTPSGVDCKPYGRAVL
jgi:hypothetical protein